MASRDQRERLVAEFVERELPSWVRSFRGPFERPDADRGVALRDFLAAGDRKAALLGLAERYMDEHLSNLAVPALRYSDGQLQASVGVLVGDPDDAAHLAEENPAKDPGNFPFPVASLPTQPDAARWREQRQRVADAFLPGASLAGMVPALQEGVQELLDRWARLGVVEAHAELHHAALDLFLRGMCGVRGLLPPEPEASAEIREALNLDALPDPRELLRTMPQRLRFAEQLLAAPAEAPGPLLRRLRAVAEPGERLAEAAAFLVAGHDTTAHTLQWALLELARHPEVQEACRAEAEAVLSELEARGAALSYAELPRFEATTAVIAEVLRLWGPAWTVFGRELSAEARLRGRGGRLVALPRGTRVDFWFYGHHQSPRLWGADAHAFRPFERGFTDAEVQRRGSRTPCSRRFHPFSLPSRDCLGKNFSLMEMRLLLPQLLRRFGVGLAEPSLSAVRGLSFGRGEAFLRRARQPGPIKPPPDGRLWLRISPRSPPSRL